MELVGVLEGRRQRSKSLLHLYKIVNVVYASELGRILRGHANGNSTSRNQRQYLGLTA